MSSVDLTILTQLGIDSRKMTCDELAAIMVERVGVLEVLSWISQLASEEDHELLWYDEAVDLLSQMFEVDDNIIAFVDWIRENGIDTKG